MSAWTRGDTVARLKAQRQPVVDDAAAAAEEAVKDNSKQREVKQEDKEVTEDTTSVAAPPVEATATESSSVPPQHAAASETAAAPAPTTVQLGPLRLPHDIAALVHPGLYKFVGQLEAHKEEATTHAEPASHNGTADAARAVTHPDNDNSNAAAAVAQVREAYAFPQPAMFADEHAVPAADQVEAATTAAQPSSVPRQRPPRNGGNAGRRTKNGYNHNNTAAPLQPPQRMRGRQGRFNPLPIAPPATLPLDLHPFGEIPRQYALRRQYAMHATSSAAPHTEGDVTLAPPPPPSLQPEAPLYYGPSASHFAGLNANAMPYHASPIPYGPDPYSVDPYSHVMMGVPFHPTNRLQLRPPYVPRS